MLSRSKRPQRTGTVLSVALVTSALNAVVAVGGTSPAAAAAEKPKLLGVTPTGTTALPGAKAATCRGVQL